MKKSKINAAAEKDAVKETKTGAATETEKIKDSALDAAENKVAAESPAATENGGVSDGNESERVRFCERARKTRNDKVLICFVALFCAFILFFTGFFAGSCGNAATRKAKEIIRLIDKYSVTVEGDADKDEVARAIVSALLADDKYAVYYSKEEYARVLNEDKGVYAGAGFTFLSDENGNIAGDALYGVQNNSPAFKAGVKAGDKIVAAKIATGGERREFADNAALVSFLSEVPAYTDITFYVLRYGELSEREFTFAKESYTTSYVNYYDCDDRMYFYSENAEKTQARVAAGEGKPELAGDTALIEFGAFEGDAAREFKTALDYMREKGKTKLVLDLRNNGGGLMTVLSDVASYLIYNGGKSKSEIAVAISKDGGKDRYYTSGNRYYDNVKKIAVIANANTASASECLIGALLYYGGTGGAAFSEDNLVLTYNPARGDYSTYGKGIMQTTYTLATGGAFKLTTAYIYQPDGKTCIHGTGITVSSELSRVADGDALSRAAATLADLP